MRSEDRWAMEEFSSIDFGDKRLKERLIKLAEKLSDSPESSINEACEDWAGAKAAYRFFQNEKISESPILASHIKQTVERMRGSEIVLAIQDKSFFNYTSHPCTEGLGKITSHLSTSQKKVPVHGLVMHTCFAVGTDGIPLGLLDQRIYARKPVTAKKSELKNIPIEKKESFGWLQSLRGSLLATQQTKTKIVTVCDREADIYEFFELAERMDSPVLVRAFHDRKLDKRNSQARLWDHMAHLRSEGTLQVNVPAKTSRPARIATLEIRFGKVTLPKKTVSSEKVLTLNVVYVKEIRPPSKDQALEWMLLTQIPVNTISEAMEKVRWYCLRWRIEMFHKVLKSGLQVESCRLAKAERLRRYLTLMSIIAWRIFWTAFVSRSTPEERCTTILHDHEWKVLYCKIHHTKTIPKITPSVYEAVRWIARLGGFLARKHDGEPGMVTLWRGWKKLFYLAEGWELATK